MGECNSRSGQSRMILVRASPTIHLLVVGHLAMSFAYYFQVWPADPSNLLIMDNAPGLGETPVERVLTLLLSLLYMVTILPLLLSKTLKLNPEAALLCPFLYHLARLSTYVFLPGSLSAYHNGLLPGLVFHFIMLLLCSTNWLCE